MNNKKIFCADCLYSIDIRDHPKYYCALKDKSSSEICDDFKKTILSNLDDKNNK